MVTDSMAALRILSAYAGREGLKFPQVVSDFFLLQRDFERRALAGQPPCSLLRFPRIEMYFEGDLINNFIAGIQSGNLPQTKLPDNRSLRQQFENAAQLWREFQDAMERSFYPDDDEFSNNGRLLEAPLGSNLNDCLQELRRSEWYDLFKIAASEIIVLGVTLIYMARGARICCDTADLFGNEDPIDTVDRFSKLLLSVQTRVDTLIDAGIRTL